MKMTKLRPIPTITAIFVGILLWMSVGGSGHEASSWTASSAQSSDPCAWTIDDDDDQISSVFKASGHAGLAALSHPTIASTPAHVHAQRRTFPGLRNSLGRTLAEHIGSTVTACRFGLLDFKHIVFVNHSFLFIIDVLRI